MKLVAGVAITATILFFVAISVIIPVLYVKGTERQVDLHVVKTERVYSNGESKYLVYAKEGTFRNEDSLLNGKFDSSDLYGRLVGGKEYNCKVYGWRLPYFSSYPNIVECDTK